MLNFQSLREKMLLQKEDNGTLVEILDILEVISPNQSQVMVRVQAGEEEQDPESVPKQSLIFPSGERLPRCWLDANYQKT
ncbi:acetyltransferase [Altericista sp. CCNU0014]|uniref:acetyltransferase n=1 Tax=Altericista sp. CCNU0014 TaxID=3082949 RepID=UPI00384FD598